MIPRFKDGRNGLNFDGFPPPMYGTWAQPFHSVAPYRYLIRGNTYHLKARPDGIQNYIPYLGTNLLFRSGRIDEMINAARKAVIEALSISGCMGSQRLFEYVINSVSMEHQSIDFLDMIKIMIKFVEEGWVLVKVNSTNVMDWDWCKYTFHA